MSSPLILVYVSSDGCFRFSPRACTAAGVQRHPSPMRIWEGRNAWAKFHEIAPMFAHCVAFSRENRAMGARFCGTRGRLSKRGATCRLHLAHSCGAPWGRSCHGARSRRRPMRSVRRTARAGRPPSASQARTSRTQRTPLKQCRLTLTHTRGNRTLFRRL